MPTEYPTRDDLSAAAQAVIDTLDIRSGTDHEFDPYSALCGMFDIAHTLYWLDPSAVPAAWQFSPGMGDWDLAPCSESEAGDCDAHGTDCEVPRNLLYALEVYTPDPYFNTNGRRAESALIEAGNALKPYSRLSEV